VIAVTHYHRQTGQSRTTSQMYSYNSNTDTIPGKAQDLGWYQDDFDDCYQLRLTPEKSPPAFGGPLLLPRIRPQDQTAEPGSKANNSFLTSLAASENNILPNVYFDTPQAGIFRRSISPSQHSHYISPISSQSNSSSTFSAGTSSPGYDQTPSRPSLSHRRTISSSSFRTHSRNTSSSTISEDDLRKYGYPTRYRATSSGVVQTPASKMSAALGHLTPMSGFSDRSSRATPPSLTRARTTSPPANQSRLSMELIYDPACDLGSTSTLLDYLTSANPTPALVLQKPEHSQLQNTHFWFDVRNLRSWSNFNVGTIAATPGLLQLLQCPVNASALPVPSKNNNNPNTVHRLHDLCRDFHSVKVNAALKVAQGEKHMVMRSLTFGRGDRQQAEFVSNYQSDTAKTIFGNGRGRVVGLIRCFDEWNTGMRSESPSQRIRYLQGLADVHRFMREHGCRYGFLMTEIELVCVRCGGEPDENNVPYFGFLELSIPIQMATHCSIPTNNSSNLQMTATLALFYLHMLAKESPLPGQYGWKMEIGAPTAVTRKRHLERDDWMPKPSVKEKRDALSRRGWFWPDEAFSRKEAPKARKGAARR